MPSRMFSRIDMLNHMFSWNTTAMLLRSDSRVTFRNIDAIDGHAPFIPAHRAGGSD